MTTLTPSDIITRLGLAELPEEMQMTILAKMTESVIKRIAVEVLEQLSEADRETLFALQVKGDIAETERFLRGKIAGYDRLADKVVGEFTAEMRDTVAALKKQ